MLLMTFMIKIQLYSIIQELNYHINCKLIILINNSLLLILLMLFISMIMILLLLLIIYYNDLFLNLK